MNKLRLSLSWLAVGVLLAAPTFWRYELSDAPTWTCSKDGDRTCVGEPTLYHRLGLSSSWDPASPRIESMPVVLLDAIDLASPSEAELGMVDLRASNSCWSYRPAGHSWCWGLRFGFWQMPATYDLTSPGAERASEDVAAAFNVFLRSSRQRTFRVPRPRPFAPWQLLVYAAATALALTTVRWMQRARTQAWLDAVAAIPPSARAAPYRDAGSCA